MITEYKKQALVLRRFYMAAGTAGIVPVALLVFYGLGLIAWSVLLTTIFAVAWIIAAFYLVFRLHLNKLFPDPSLTAEMMLVSFLTTACIMYFVPNLRGEFSILYPVIMLFGVINLGMRKLFWLALCAGAFHVTALLLWHFNHRDVPLAGSIGQVTLLTLVLPWFGAMGGYVSNLRANVSESNARLKEALKQIEDIAIKDSLTGAFNRRHLQEVLNSEIARAKRNALPLSLCMFDIDFFKKINDSFGHCAGDVVLQQFVQNIKGSLRTGDIFGRYGGEEFLLIMPSTDSDGAIQVAERIRKSIEESRFQGVPEDYTVTTTVGVSSLRPQDTDASLLECADQGLYKGKRSGRNCVVMMGEGK